MNTKRKLRLAILGCGAVSELGHLPALNGIQNVQVNLLVDKNAERRESLAAAFRVPNTADDVDGCFHLFDAAVVALPHALHAPVSIQLLEHGKAVLVEKPLATTVAECEAMLEAARRTDTVLAVGLIRRFLRSHRFAFSLVENEILGRIVSFRFEEGNVYDWPVASDFFFRKETAGGGVLADTGAHTLDSLYYWLGDFAEVEYFDDAEGGVEANCRLNLRMQCGAVGTVELSRTRNFPNRAIIRGERGVLEVSWEKVRMSLPDQPYFLSGRVGNFINGSEETQDFFSLFKSQMEDFVDAVNEGRPPCVTGESAINSVRLIEACYGRRRPLDLSWERI